MVHLKDLEIGKKYIIYRKESYISGPTYKVLVLEKILKTKIKFSDLDVAICDLEKIYHYTEYALNKVKDNINKYYKSLMVYNLENIVKCKYDQEILIDIMKDVEKGKINLLKGDKN